MRFRLIALTILLMTVIACDSLGPFVSPTARDAEMTGAPPPPMARMAFGVQSASPNRRTLQQGSLSIEVSNIVTATERVRAIAEGVNGFVADSRSYEDNSGRKMMDLTLRIPEKRLPETLQALARLGAIREEALSGEDVTEQSIDLETRLVNAKRLEKRLLTLLDKRTKSVKDLLDVEKELARVRGEIESMEAQKRTLDDRVSLATIDVHLTEPPGWGRGIFDPIQGILQRVIGAFVASLALLVVVTSAAVPWIALLILATWLSLRFLRWWIHHRREMKAKKQQK